MHTRDLVKRAWADAGLYRSSDEKLQRFLQYIDKAPTECWPEYIDLFRKDYYDLFDRVVPPLIKTGDSLVIAILARSAKLSVKKEKDLLKSYIKTAHKLDDERVLYSIANIDNSSIQKELLKRKDLPESIMSYINAKTNTPPPKAYNMTPKVDE